MILISLLLTFKVVISKIFKVCLFKDVSRIFNGKLFLPKIEWCKIVAGIKFTPLLDNVLEMAKLYAKDMIGLCSETGSFKVSNLFLSGFSFLAQVRDGDYKNVFTLDDTDENIFNLTNIATIRH